MISEKSSWEKIPQFSFITHNTQEEVVHFRWVHATENAPAWTERAGGSTHDAHSKAVNAPDY